MSIYTANFGQFPIRFIYKDGAVYVSRSDLIEAAKDCMTGLPKDMCAQLLAGGFDEHTDSTDKRAAVIAPDTIGPVVHIFAAGGILTTIASLRDQTNANIRESAFRMNTFCRWYAEAMCLATNHFGMEFMDVMRMGVKRLDKISPAHQVTVTLDGDIWIAECDTLGLVTEAESYDALVERAWAIAPELAELNLGITDESDLRLRFEYESARSSSDLMAM